MVHMFLAPFVFLAYHSIPYVHAAQLSIGNAALRPNNVNDALARRTSEGILRAGNHLAFHFQSNRRNSVLHHNERKARKINFVLTNEDFRYTNHQRAFHGGFDDVKETHSSLQSAQQMSTKILSNPEQHTQCYEATRRSVLFHFLSLSLIAAAQLTSHPALASEIDATGQLYSPKNDMLSRGGSDAARGIALKSKMDEKSANLLKTGGKIQNVYETRFVAYLTRFLLVFDPAANAWWKVCDIRYLFQFQLCFCLHAFCHMLSKL